MNVLGEVDYALSKGNASLLKLRQMMPLEDLSVRSLTRIQKKQSTHEFAVDRSVRPRPTMVFKEGGTPQIYRIFLEKSELMEKNQNEGHRAYEADEK